MACLFFFQSHKSYLATTNVRLLGQKHGTCESSLLLQKVTVLGSAVLIPTIRIFRGISLHACEPSVPGKKRYTLSISWPQRDKKISECRTGGVSQFYFCFACWWDIHSINKFLRSIKDSYLLEFLRNNWWFVKIFITVRWDVSCLWRSNDNNLIVNCIPLLPDY